jgi:hypothetical protein
MDAGKVGAVTVMPRGISDGFTAANWLRQSSAFPDPETTTILGGPTRGTSSEVPASRTNHWRSTSLAMLQIAFVGEEGEELSDQTFRVCFVSLFVWNFS